MEELKKDLRAVRESQIRMEGDLKEHMRRTDVLESLHNVQEARLALIEQPFLAKKYIFKSVVDMGKIIGVIISLFVIARYLGKL